MNAKPEVPFEDVSLPVGYPRAGNTVYPNRFAFMFIYAPAFDFARIEGAAGYRYEITDDLHREHTFTAESPNEPLSSVWNVLPTGFVTLKVYGIDGEGRTVALAGKRTFWKKAAFRPGSYPPKRRGYRESARLIYENRFASEEVQALIHGAQNVDYEYPTKQLAAVIRAMAHRAQIFPETAEDSLRAVRAAADCLLRISEQEGAPLEGFTPTYQPDTTAQWRGTTMLLYPAFGAGALLTAYEATGDERYLAFAKLGAGTFLRLQGEDGTWPLILSLADGSTVSTNRCLPIAHMELFRHLYAITGETAYAAAADRAYAFLERGALQTWNWEGQFEDTPASEPYRNLTLHDACTTAIYLVNRYPGNAEKTALARELLRFSEDLFANWEKPFEGGRVLLPEKDFGNYNHYWEFDQWIMPSVFEQYGCFTPVDSSAAKLLRTYLALYRAEGKELDLLKAKTLGDAITRMTDDDGLESTWWARKDLRRFIWTNCMFACAAALEELIPFEASNDEKNI